MQLNGLPATPDEIKTLALSNYGHFTSMHIERMRVRGLDLHLERLRRDSLALYGTALDLDYVRHLIRQAVTDAPSVVARVTVFDPAFDFGHPSADISPKILVTTRDATGGPLAPLAVRSVAYERDLPLVKHVGLFATINHRRAAQLDGFDDVLFTDAAGLVSEGATWNIGFIAHDQVVWPDRPCLPGVTMKLLQDHATSANRAPVSIGDLSSYTGAFVTNAAVGLRAVTAINGTCWPASQPLIDLLRKQYAEIPAEPI
jgi:branched-subunit amino acid aminotransferase/4-amino-4-deoxychorismate lyase